MKKTVCVLFGGKSSEYEVSLRSCAFVLKNIDREIFDVVTVGITREGTWYLYTGEIENIEKDIWEKGDCKKVVVDHNPKDTSLLVLNGDGYEKINVDVYFPVLHGSNGEDGRLQGLFDMAGASYVGCGTLSSAVGMDKEYAKIIFAHFGIPQADWVTIRSYHDLDKKVAEIEERLSYPVFVKPANAGSSLGAGKAKSRDELLKAIENAFKYDSKVLAEQLLKGHEVECAVLGKCGDVAVSTVGEIVADEEFYTYDSKYSATSTSSLNIPAPISESAAEKVKAFAVCAFEAVSGKGLSRVDFFVDGEEVKINEINTLPGFTSISMYPKLFDYCGVDGKQLLTKLIELAF